MAEQEKLPKPLTDLPLPEKEIPANVGVGARPVWKSKLLWGFVVASTLIAFLIGGFVLGRTSSKKLPAQTVVQTPSPTPESPTSSASADTSTWKTYTTSAFQINYPSAWYVNQYADKNPLVVEVSDVKDSPLEFSGMSEDHTRIQVSHNSGSMPSCFPYGNGGTECTNSTIKQFSINGYSGIMGQQSSEAGITDVFLLKDPSGKGWIWLSLIPPQKNNTEVKGIFNQMLSTFKFTQ